MEWIDDAIVLGGRKHGEGSLVVSLLTRARGVERGLVRGAVRSRERGIYEPGNLVTATWKARLQEHLGMLKLESQGNPAALAMADPLRLACLEAATSLAEAALPPHVPHPGAYARLAELLEAIGRNDSWAPRYLAYEMGLLDELGFGLDLGSCAVTGTTTDLAFVSPRTGRAVSREAAGVYADRLLVLPRLLGGIGGEGDEAADLLHGLALTGFFLDARVFHPAQRNLPPSRARYLDRLRKAAESR
jgi:DNA repair protein RecO (recombination protein O)